MYLVRVRSFGAGARGFGFGGDYDGYDWVRRMGRRRGGSGRGRGTRGNVGGYGYGYGDDGGVEDGEVRPLLGG